MRNVWRVSVCLAVLAFAVNVAQAQRPRPGTGGGFDRSRLTSLMVNKSVQEELKVTDDQKKKLEEVATKARELMTEKTKGLGRDDREKFAAAAKEVNQAVEKDLSSALKEDQVKRLKQIQRQQMGAHAFTNEDVQKTLKISDEQKKELTSIIEEGSKKIEEESKGLNFFRDREKMADIRTKVNKETMGKIASKLSADQKKAWKELTGDPVEVKFERPGGTRPGGTRPGTPGTPSRPRPDLSF